MLFPLYLFDHSGITISLSPFTCPWDSGQVGYVLVEKEKAIREFGKKKLTKQARDKVYRCIQGEVTTYDQYLSGEVYGYEIEDAGESCWGFYGQDKCMAEARSVVDYIVRRKIKEHCNQVKQWIRNRVPLICRIQ